METVRGGKELCKSVLVKNYRIFWGFQLQLPHGSSFFVLFPQVHIIGM